MTLDIVNRYSRAVLYSSATAQTIAEAVIEANLSGANLSGADLSQANLIGADLSQANLIGADLIGADLSQANLREADLRRANLIGADLSGADLSGADLRQADLRQANLSGADLSGANLDQWSTVIVASRHMVTVYPDRVNIGCHTRTLAKWMDSYERIGADEGYTADQIAEYGEILKRVTKLYEVMG